MFRTRLCAPEHIVALRETRRARSRHDDEQHQHDERNKRSPADCDDVEMQSGAGVGCAREAGGEQRRERPSDRDREEGPGESNDPGSKHPQAEQLTSRHTERAQRRILDAFRHRLTAQRLAENERSDDRKAQSEELERDRLQVERAFDVPREILLSVPDNRVAVRDAGDRIDERGDVGGAVFETNERVRECPPTLVRGIERRREMDPRRTDVGIGRKLSRHRDDPGDGEPRRDDGRVLAERVLNQPHGDRHAHPGVHRRGYSDRNGYLVCTIDARQSSGDHLGGVERPVHPWVGRCDATRSPLRSIEEVRREVIRDLGDRAQLLERDWLVESEERHGVRPDAEQELIERMRRLQETRVRAVRSARAGRGRERQACECSKEQGKAEPAAPSRAQLSAETESDRPHATTNRTSAGRLGEEGRHACSAGGGTTRRRRGLERAGGESIAPRRLAGCSWA